MITGTRVLNLTIDEGGVPPHVKPLVAAIVSAVEYGNWGEVTHSTCTVQELEESQDDLAEALEESEAELQEVKQAGRDLAEEVETFCDSAEVVAVSMALKKAYEVVSNPELEGADIADLLEQIDQAEEDFVRVVKELKTYVRGKLEDFQG